MAAADPVPAPATDLLELNGHRYTFPPFPSVPAGVHIVPFKDFREYGTRRVVGDDGIERDGLGIPTVRIRPSGGKKGKSKQSGVNQPGSAKAPWWVEWEKAHDHPRYRDPYSSDLSPAERFQQAAADFDQHYQPCVIVHLQKIWNNFTNFVGVKTEPLPTASEPQASVDEGSMSDDEIDEIPSLTVEDDLSVPAKPESPTSDTTMEINSTADKTAMFLVDPSKQLGIFFSSYMLKKGLLWDPLKLTAAPRMLRFFLRFLARTAPGLLTKSQSSRAMKMVDAAERELPCIPRIAGVIPDAFGEACVEEWGRVGTLRMEWGDEDEKQDADEERAKKRAKHDHLDGGGEEDADEKDAEMKPALTQPGTPSTDAADAGWGTQTEDTQSVWGSDSNAGWGTNTDALIGDDNTGPAWADASGGGWGDSQGGWGTSDANGDGAPAAASAYALPPVPTLAGVLGPESAASLTVTHTAGAAERSVRRIASITLPTAPSAPSESPTHSADDTGIAVLARVVLEPWPAWDSAHRPDSAPRLLKAGSSAHDAETDKITLCVVPAAAEVLQECVGMGLYGTWVRLEVRSDENLQDKAKEVGANEEKDSVWYAEDLLMTLPSFHAPCD